MKKVAVFLAAIALTTGVFAQSQPLQPPTKDIDWFGSGKEYRDAEEAEKETGIRHAKSTPIAPATLLLLGLGGAVVGTKVVRNRRKE